MIECLSAVVNRSLDVEGRVLRLLVARPRRHGKQQRVVREVVEQVRVLADAWLEEGRGAGEVLAARLRGVLSEARCDELGVARWFSVCSLPRLVLLLVSDAVLAEAARDFDLAFDVVSWLGDDRHDSAVHARVADFVTELLGAVERGERTVVGRAGPKVQFDSRWSVWLTRAADEPGYEGIFRVDRPDGHGVELSSISGGPLFAVKTYAPPARLYHVLD